MEVTNYNDDIEVDVKEELGVGLKIPSSVKTPASYLSTLSKYKDIYNDIYKQIEVSNKLYKYNSIIGNAVDTLVDFAITSVWPEATGHKKLDSILEHWFREVNNVNTNTLPGVYPLMQELGLEWFTSGNAFPYKKWVNEKIGKGYYKLPMGVNLINPESISIPTGPIAFGQEVIYLKYDSDLITKLRSDGRSDPEAALIKQAIPKSVLNAIKNNSSSFTEGIRLNPKYISHLKRRAKGYQAWGVPYLTRCFSSASIMEKLRELDESITTGLINLITIFKIGTEEHPANNNRLKQFASLIRNPSATQTLVWAHDVDILQVGPDGKVLGFKEKYKDAKEDILIGLGVPPVLMSMKQQGDEWVSILALIERLTYWRKTITIWLEQTCNEIAKYNGIDKRVSVKWERMNLADESSVKNLVLAFYDRGLISINTALKEAGYSLEKQFNEKNLETTKMKESFQPPELPFSKKGEVEKTHLKDSDPKMTGKETKKSVVKKENTIDLKEQKKKNKPKKRE